MLNVITILDAKIVRTVLFGVIVAFEIIDTNTGMHATAKNQID